MEREAVLILQLLYFENNRKDKLCFYWNSAFNGWIYFWKIDQTHFENTVNFNGVVRDGIFGKLGFELHRCIRKNGNFHFNRVEFRIKNRECVNT